MDYKKHYFLGPAYFIASDNLYLLAVLNSKIAFDLLLEICSVLGDEEKKGRAVLRPAYFKKLPIPTASQNEQKEIVQLAQDAQHLHLQRREKVEQFLKEIGIVPARSSSRNILEQPWTLSKEEFLHRSGNKPLRIFNDIKDETDSLNKQIDKVEKEIEQYIVGLYGL